MAPNPQIDFSRIRPHRGDRALGFEELTRQLLAAEKLRELHGISLGRETVRAWMIAAGFWQERKKRRRRIHQPRYRRDCVGELIQIDGSEHRWFEDRGPMCTLLVYIDDATSQLMHLRFVETESTFAYFAATQASPADGPVRGEVAGRGGHSGRS